MKLGEQVGAARHIIKAFGLSLALALAPQAALAASPGPDTAAETQILQDVTEEERADVPLVEDIANRVASGEAGGDPQAAGPVERMKPTEGVGMPTQGGIGLQEQYSALGQYGYWVHNVVLMPIIAAICLLVLGLLLVVIVRYNRRANPVASKTSHNTTIEIIWTLVPVLILVGIAVPSIDLLAKQYKPAPADALTIKVTGNQWYWTYGYPDNGDFEIVSNMLNIPGAPTVNNGVREVGTDPSDGPSHFEVDNRLVVPAGETLRLQITAADVIHAFAVPSLWFKLDAVPGRINEKTLLIEKPGVYYGQCSELCGPKHGYMPIAIEALPREQFEAWVRSQPGGTVRGEESASAPEPAPEGEAAEPVSPADPA